MKDKSKNVKENIKKGASKIKDKVAIIDNRDTVKPIVISRMLFYSVYNFILLVVFFGNLIFDVYACFKELRYFGFLPGLRIVIASAIELFIVYLILNWIYKCVVKSMLCITEKEVYGELYIPFYRYETSIPLNKITGVTTINFLWIFRTVIIHQYGKMPFIWQTWNNKEFKDELVKLTTGENKKVEAQEGHEGLIPKTWKKGMLIVLIVIAVILVLGLILNGIDKASYSTKVNRIPGTYVYNDEKIVLNKDNTCELEGIIDDDETMIDCSWEINTSDETTPIVTINYSYYSYYTSYFYNTKQKSEHDDFITLTYQDSKTLSDMFGNTYTKE